MRALGGLALTVAAVACAGPRAQPPPSSASMETGPTEGLPGVALGEDLLHPRAFAAAAAFLFPDETRALAHALLRAEFARREAARLEIAVDEAEVDAALDAAVRGLEAQAAATGGLEEWARSRYGRSWSQVEASLRRQLRDNQRYQLCARAWSGAQPQVRLRMLTTRERAQAEAWVRQIRAGAASAALAGESLDPGPAGDGSLPPLPAALPAPLGEALAGAEPGAVLAPLRFDGESVWRVVVLLGREAGQPAQPPRSALLASVRERPIAPLEERAWFAAMVDRYNAREGLPAFEPPPEAFVRRPAR